jgi:hypothetical protein
MLIKNALYIKKKNKCIKYSNGVYKAGKDKLYLSLKSSQVLKCSIRIINQS